MGHYKSNVRDIEFNLFEMFDTDGVLKTGAFGDLDSDTVRMMLEEASKLAEGPVAAAFESSDRTPPSFDADTHDVSLPADFKASVNAWTEADWEKIGLIEEVGGIPAPATVSWAINEFMCGALPAGFFYLAGPAFASLLYKNGNEEQKHWAQMAVEKNWGATMVLTEPEAGSDVGAGRTKAIDQGDGTWHIEGEKRFITSGDSDDLFENIFHYTLARPEGAGPGTKGLSLFVVPKWHFDSETGELGARNGVNVTSIEHKMGIKASATCDMAFGDGDNPAVGYLVGDVHQGIRQMFDVIEFARMMVGTKAIATLSTGYLNALEYAKERVQGADLTQIMDKTAPRVTVIAHPDVRRLLLDQRAFVEGGRAFALWVATLIDAHARTGDEGALALVSLLTPVLKGFLTDKGFDSCVQAQQVFGGHGYIEETGLSQFVRDARIAMIYEGANGIQALDLVGRKLGMDGGKPIMAFFALVRAFLKENEADPRLKSDFLDPLESAARDLQSAAEFFVQNLKSPDAALAGATDFLHLFGHVCLGLMWARMARAALARDDAFATAKLATGRYHMARTLPATALHLARIRSGASPVMALPADAF